MKSTLHMRHAVWLLLLNCAPWWAGSATAVPANPEGREVVQPDGTKIIVHPHGDEFFSWNETADGYPIVKDSADGFWKYAQPGTDKAEFRAIKGARVGSADPVRQGLKKRALPDAAVLRKHVQQRRRAILGEPEEQGQAAAKTLAAPVAEPPLDEPPPDEPPHPVPVQGVKSVKNLVILACFSNHWDDVNGTVLSSYGRVDTNDYHNLFNQEGYNADGAVGSFRDYYKEVSYGKLTIDSTVTVWVKLPREESYYGAGAHGGIPGTMAADAVAAAEAAGVDFSPFDSDGDGWVDILDVIHSGYGEEADSANHPEWVWSVKGSMSSVVTNDGVKMKLYHTEPALRGNSGTGITRIGVICHETGHFFGLPDLYDYSPNTAGLGGWCLMAGGSWGGAEGESPTHPSAWAKVFLGFAKTVPVHSKTGLSLPRVEDNAVVGLLRDGMSNDEYFLIENRAKVGFDNCPEINPGLLVYHVDQRNANNDLGTWPHPAVKLEEADGNDSLGTGGGGAQAGDAWTSTSGLAGGFRDQTGNTNTTAMFYQPNPTTNIVYSYSRTNAAASYSYNRLNNFSAAGSAMTFDVQSLKTDAPTQNALPAPFAVAWAASSEAVKYEIQEGSPTTFTSFSDGAESADDLHDNWYVHGKTKREVTPTNHGGSACYSLTSGDYGAVQSLVLRKPFKVSASTVVSFYFMSHVASGNGFLKCEISNDGGDTWKTLGTYNGYIDPWSQRTYGFAAINAAGIDSGDLCVLRFVMDMENTSGWSAFPRYGFALDDIAITGTEIAGYGGWTTLDNNVAATSYVISGKSAGVYAYRVQPYANGAWQGYGAVGETTVGANHAPAFTSDPVAGVAARVGGAYSGDLGLLAQDSDVNDTLVFSKAGGAAWLTIAADGTLSGTPLPGDLGVNVFTARVTDLAGAYDEAQVQIFVGLPASGLNSNLVAYLPFDADYQDYSGRANHPGQSNVNLRAAGHLGANGYVLTNSGYLSFGQLPDLHFADTAAGNATSFSVSFWAKLPVGSYGGAPAFIANKDWASDGNTGWALASGPGAGTNGYFQMNFKESNANARNYDWTAAPGSGWHHYLVVFKRDATRTAFTYVDGVQVQSNNLFATGGNIDGAGLPVNIGQDGTSVGTRGTWTNAMMDDFAFWRRALTANDVAAIYKAGTNGFALAYAQAVPVITNLTADLTLPAGAETNLAVAVLSATASTYQWRLGGTPVGGATAAILTLTNQGQASPLSYDVVVSNAHGATTSRTIVVTLETIQNQTIDFPAIGDQLTTDTVGLAATASSGLPVSFAVGSGPATITGATNLSFTGAGSVSIVASQAGDANWNPAPNVTNTFMVNKASAVVNLADLAQEYNGLPKNASATTVPPGLMVDLTYDGVPFAPTAAGSYAVTGTINDVLYQGSAAGTLVIGKAIASVMLDNLAHIYDGSAKSATAITTPMGLAVDFTYDGSPTAPTAAGSYAVTGTVNDVNYTGSAAGTLVIQDLMMPTLTAGAYMGSYVTRAQLDWHQTQGKRVLITVATESYIQGTPVPGTAYSPNDTIGNQTVLWGGADVSPLVVTNLQPGHTYHFTAYAENAAHYSAGMTASVTLGYPPVRNPNQGPPQAPADIYLGDTGGVFGCEIQEVEFSESRARVWISRFMDLWVTGQPGLWSPFSASGMKTAQAPAVFTETGLYFWGIQVDFGPTFGDDFWYVADSEAPLAPRVLRPAALASGSTLLLDIKPIVDPGSVTGAPDSGAPHAAIDLSWTLNARLNEVLVVRWPAGTPPVPPLQGQPLNVGPFGEGSVIYRGSSTSHEDAALPPDTSFDYVFYSVNNDYYSTGAVIRVSTAACVPAAPAGLAAVPAATAFTAQWEATATATNYFMDVGTDAGFAAFVPGYENLAVGNVLSHEVVGLTPGQTYHGRVRAQNECGTGTNSGAIQVTIPKTDQTLDFPAIGDKLTTDTVGLAATASSGLPVSFAVASGPATISAGTNLSFTGAGTVSIVASQAGNANWNPAPEVTNTFTVTKAAATVNLADLAQVYNGMPRNVSATTVPPGLTVAMTYDGSPVAPTAAGSYAVTGTINDVLYQGSAAGTLMITNPPTPFEQWLLDQNLDPEDPRYDPAADDDRDGATTEEEFLADTDPALAGSVFVITGAYDMATAPGGTGEIRLAFPASTARYYQLEYCIDLTNHTIGVSNLGWGVPGMVVTGNAPGTWYGVIRSRLTAP